VYGSPGTNGLAQVGGLISTGACLINCLVTTNVPTNCLGQLTDAGHNLSSDASCAFTNIGSLNNTDPKLGLLANNGGPTLTMALLPGSPAIDAGDTAAAPSVDQRGFPRPVGAAADIGAYEYIYPGLLRASQPLGGGVDVLLYGTAGQSCRLLSSTDLQNWTPIATNVIGANATWLYHDDASQSKAFYRVAFP
jgi:hypothetical protein